MFITEILFILCLAFLFTLIFTKGCKRCGPWDNALLFFIVLFLATWGIGRWVTPIGPVLFGFYWLPFLLIAVIISLLLAVMAPSKKPKTAKEAQDLAYEEVAVEKALDMFFWILIIVLLFSIFSGYWWARPAF
jgi:hypothetical protein